MVELDETSRARAVQLIQRIRAPQTSSELRGSLAEELKRLLVCPDVLTYIMLDVPVLTDDEVIEKALRYRPIAL